MNSKLSHLLVRLYPRGWRDRYGAEFAALLQSRQDGFREIVNVVCSAMGERITPTIPRNAASSFSRFHLWCIQAPWLIFGLGPGFLLLMTYFFVCLYLWAGWEIFVPNAETPFGHGSGSMYGIQNIYFQLGKFCYLGGPILVGWAIAVTAIRRKVRSGWLVIALVSTAWIGCAAQIRASRSFVHGFGHIRMSFPSHVCLQHIHEDPFQASTILLLTEVPYVMWLYRSKEHENWRQNQPEPSR